MKWIKTSDRLPEPGKPVLIWNEKSDVVTVGSIISYGRDYPKINWEITDDEHDQDWVEIENYPYWMPLPEGPKDDC